MGSTRGSIFGSGERRAGWIFSRPGRLVVGDGSLVGGFLCLVLGLGEGKLGDTDLERSALAGIGGSGRLMGGRECIESLDMLEVRLGM